MLQCYKEAGIGFGAATNIKTSILQCTFECPFLGVRLKDPNSVIICILASSVPINDDDIAAFLHTFRQTTAYTRDIVVSMVYEPNVEHNLLITTILALGVNVQQSFQSGGILSRLAMHFLHVFSFWGRHYQQQVQAGKEGAVSPQEAMGSYENNEEPNRTDFIDDNFKEYHEEFKPAVSSNSSEFPSSSNRVSEKEDEVLFHTVAKYSILSDSITEGVALGDSPFQREQLENWNLGPGFELAKEWAQERVADATPMVDNLSIFHLPDGSIYDGLWRYGKRSGPGTFYFKNGDMFQGSWRDDVMHGKGWFYFHSGDRWFANFWKGKANGEGRFYTKSGDAFFGNFKDGWRHGKLLCINANGTRYIEIWEQGALIDTQHLDR